MNDLDDILKTIAKIYESANRSRFEIDFEFWLKSAKLWSDIVSMKIDIYLKESKNVILTNESKNKERV